MTNITKLESRSIEKVSKLLKECSKSYERNMDSIQDFIHKQFKIVTDEPETLGSTRKHLELLVKNIEIIEEELELIRDHFELK